MVHDPLYLHIYIYIERERERERERQGGRVGEVEIHGTHLTKKSCHITSEVRSLLQSKLMNLSFQTHTHTLYIYIYIYI